MSEENQLATIQTGQIQTMEEMERMAKHVAESKLFGVTNSAQAICLFAICQSEGLNPISALKRYHLIEGRPSMRADAIQGEFQARGGGIIFHVRTNDMVCATFFADRKTIDDKARDRAAKRFELLWSLDSEEDPNARGKIMVELSKISREGEETVLRTFADAVKTGLATGKDGIKKNWQVHTRAMLTARTISEGVRAIDPGLIAGVYTPEETQDIAETERAEREQTKVELTNRLDAGNGSLTGQDKEAIKAMISQYREDAKNANPTEKSRLLGLASELQCKLDDDEIPMTHPENEAMAETVTEQAKPTEQKTKYTEDKAPETSADWRDVQVHRGSASMGLLGKKVGAIFTADLSEKRALALKDHYEQMLGGSKDKMDLALLSAVRFGFEFWQQSNQTTETSKTEIQPATATDWKSHIVESSNPKRNGRRLDDFTRQELEELQDDIEKVPSSKITTKIKKTMAMVVLALASMPIQDPRETIVERLAENGVKVSDFLCACAEFKWAKNPADLMTITHDEANAILSDWENVLKSC